VYTRSENIFPFQPILLRNMADYNWFILPNRPDVLPCRDTEWSDVFDKVYSLLEEGSGGCVCKYLHVFHSASTPFPLISILTVFFSLFAYRHLRCSRHRQNRDCACSGQGTEENGRGECQFFFFSSRSMYPAHLRPFLQETSPFTYVEINGLKIPEPSTAYSLLWEAVSGHDTKKEGHMRVSAKESLRNLVEWFKERSRGRGMGSEHAWLVVSRPRLY
jgi:hypothetical protein